MVVFVDAEPDKSRYRKFDIKAKHGQSNDDFASMYETLCRRFRRARVSDNENWKLPDLLVVDGGKGQLGVALAAARDSGIDVTWGQGLAIVGVAKSDVSMSDNLRQDAQGPIQVGKKSAGAMDRLFLPHAKDPIAIRQNSGEMFLIQRLRDEAHRFAITAHQAKRKKRTLQSALGDIPGIGPSRQKNLLTHLQLARGQGRHPARARNGPRHGKSRRQGRVRNV